MTITEFLLARIAEDEASAMEARGGPWTVDVADGRADGVHMVCHASFEMGDLTDGSMRHIARHDPARVLAECEAKRRILDLHAVVPLANSAPWCETCDSAAMDYPCPTLRALASVYADHPDYDPAWRAD